MTEIHLSERDRGFIEEQVQAGIFENADAVIAAGLRLLGSNEGKLAELQRLIRKGSMMSRLDGSWNLRVRTTLPLIF
jgi:antitoxin ParD1/3/4